MFLGASAVALPLPLPDSATRFGAAPLPLPGCARCHYPRKGYARHPYQYQVCTTLRVHHILLLGSHSQPLPLPGYARYHYRYQVALRAVTRTVTWWRVLGSACYRYPYQVTHVTSYHYPYLVVGIRFGVLPLPGVRRYALPLPLPGYAYSACCRYQVRRVTNSALPGYSAFGVTLTRLLISARHRYPVRSVRRTPIPLPGGRLGDVPIPLPGRPKKRTKKKTAEPVTVQQSSHR